MGPFEHNLNWKRQRLISSSHLELIYSVASLHTETINIWTHILGTVIFTRSTIKFGTMCTAPPSPEMSAILVYLIAATFCFFCSTLYHTFSDHVGACSWQYVDHLGIVIWIWATSNSFTVFSFRRKSSRQRLHMVIISVASALSMARLSSLKHGGSKNQFIRTVLHVTTGFLSTLPALDYWYTSFGKHQKFDTLRPFLSLVIVNSIGGGIYATRSLDGSVGKWLGLPDVSHNVMHVMAIVGAGIYRNGLISVHNERQKAQKAQICRRCT